MSDSLKYWQDLACANRKVAEDNQTRLAAAQNSDEHNFKRWQDTLEQRDKAVVVLKAIRRCLVEGAVTLSEKKLAAKIAIQIDNLMQECGK